MFIQRGYTRNIMLPPQNILIPDMPFDLEEYADKVLATESANLIAYWPQWEPSGTTADNYEGTAARDGTYDTVTLGQTGIGDGRTCPLFDGSDSYTDIYSASLNTAFDTGEGTIAGWVKVYNSGVWTDSTERRMFTLRTDWTNQASIYKTTANNEVAFYRAATGDNIATSTSVSTTAWFHVAITWSLTAGELKGYVDGSQIGSTESISGTWQGALNSAECNIGCKNNGTPTSPFYGWLAHCPVWTKALSGSDITDLATV